MHYCTQDPVLQKTHFSQHLSTFLPSHFIPPLSCYQHYLVKFSLPHLPSVNFSLAAITVSTVPASDAPGGILLRSGHGQPTIAPLPGWCPDPAQELSSHNPWSQETSGGARLGARRRADQILNLPGIRFTTPVITFFSL